MKLIITDLNVLFDLYHLGVLPEFFALNAEISISSFVYNEIVFSNQLKEFETYKRSKQLNVIILTEEEQVSVCQFTTMMNLKSIPDKMMLWKSIQFQCALLTCDIKLKKAAIDHGIEVYGSVWIIEKMVEENALIASKAIELLERLKMVNDRLSIEEIDKVIKKLKM
jgi:hypothetical protein